MIDNIAGYLFVYLEPSELPDLAQTMRERLAQNGLRGTILLAQEGINLFLAGADSAIAEFLQWLRADTRFATFECKHSYSNDQPFARTKVKIKREIVPLGANNLDPNRAPAPRVDAETLRRWLEEKKPLVLLDTRNRFEFEAGTFDAAVDLDIAKFRDFPEAVAAKLDAWRDHTIVTFCTGGIRCEKAAPLMQKLGFKDVYQLDGGILKYFESQGAAHYHGDCFVFDERIGLDGNLAERDPAEKLDKT